MNHLTLLPDELYNTIVSYLGLKSLNIIYTIKKPNFRFLLNTNYHELFKIISLVKSKDLHFNLYSHKQLYQDLLQFFYSDEVTKENVDNIIKEILNNDTSLDDTPYICDFVRSYIIIKKCPQLHQYWCRHSSFPIYKWIDEIITSLDTEKDYFLEWINGNDAINESAICDKEGNMIPGGSYIGLNVLLLNDQSMINIEDDLLLKRCKDYIGSLGSTDEKFPIVSLIKQKIKDLEK